MMLVALLIASASAEDVAARIRSVHEALDDWRVDDAAQIAAQLEKELPDVPPVQQAVGAVKLHQGDFEGAVAHLQRAREGGGDTALLDLAERTRKETEGTVSKESEHFLVRVPAGKDEVLIPIMLRALEDAYRELTSAFDFKPTHKIVVDVLHDSRGLASVSPLTVKEIETTGTIALCKYTRLMITSPKALARGYSWLDTVAHELTHLIISEKSHNNTPVWLHEGLAKYNETRWRGAAGLALDPSSENLLANAVRKGTLITFEQMHPSMAKLPSQEDAALAFAEVFSVIEWISQVHPESGGRRSTSVLLERLRDGASMDVAMTAAVGLDLEGMQREWRAWLRKRPFKLVPGAAPKKLTFVKNARGGGADTEEREDEAALDEASTHGDVKAGEARKMVRLGNLLRMKRRLVAAGVEYEKARALLGPRTPALGNRLAGVYLETKRPELAKKVLEESVAVFPDDPQTHVLLARTAILMKDWATARRHDELALRENPFNPEVWAGLRLVAKETGDTALARESERALEMLAKDAKRAPSPWRPRDDEPAGLVSIVSEPWGRVLIDGMETGLITPVVDLRVKPGAHRVRVTDPVTGREHGESMAVGENKVLRLSFTLQTMDPDARRKLVEEESAALRPLLSRPAPDPAVDAGPKEPAAPWELDDEEQSSVPLSLPLPIPPAPR